VGKEARSLDNLFMFRESEKSLKMTILGFIGARAKVIHFLVVWIRLVLCFFQTFCMVYNLFLGNYFSLKMMPWESLCVEEAWCSLKRLGEVLSDLVSALLGLSGGL
jgi:hypothetical protein